jgi:hypothetical protein
MVSFCSRLDSNWESFMSLSSRSVRPAPCCCMKHCMLCNVVITMSRLLPLRQWPTIMALSSSIVSQAAVSVIGASAAQLLPPLTPSYHKFHDTPNTLEIDAAFDMLPNSGSNDAILNRLQQLANAYPAFVTMTTTQKLFGVDGQDSYALIIQDKQDHRHNTDFSAQLELVDITSDWEDVVDWFRHSIYSDDASASDAVAASKDEETAKEEEEEAVPSATTTHGDIILSASTIGTDKVFGLAEVMLKAANCESTDDDGNHDVNSNVNNNFLSDRHLQCRTDLNGQGVSTQDVEWLAHLVFTRRTILLPSSATQGDDTVPHHHGSTLSVLWLVVAACVGLLLTVAFMMVLTVRRKHRNRIWLEDEAERRVALVADNYEYYESPLLQKDFKSELTSFDEVLTVQLIEPSHKVILV